MTTPHTPPERASAFNGYRCPFMPIGYRMGQLGVERLGLEAAEIPAESTDDLFTWIVEPADETVFTAEHMPGYKESR